MRESEKRGQWETSDGGKWKKVKPKGTEAPIATRKRRVPDGPIAVTRLLPDKRKATEELPDGRKGPAKPIASFAQKAAVPYAPPNKPAEKRKAPAAAPAEVPIEKSKVKPKAALAIRDEEQAEVRKFNQPVSKFQKRRPLGPIHVIRKEEIPRTIEPIEEGRFTKFIRRSAELGKVAKTALATVAQKSLDSVLDHARQGVSATTPQTILLRALAKNLVRGIKNSGRARRYKALAPKSGRRGK